MHSYISNFKYLSPVVLKKIFQYSPMYIMYLYASNQKNLGGGGGGGGGGGRAILDPETLI